MTRFLAFVSWFHVPVAMVLATVAALAVPEKAFADTGSTCFYYCWNGECPDADPTCMAACEARCCADQCGFDAVCQASCCKEACGMNASIGSDDYNKCIAKCSADPIRCVQNTVPTCSTNKNMADCQPAVPIFCPSGQADCACKWVSDPKGFACYCLNVSGK
jgi:hypothetical protein